MAAGIDGGTVNVEIARSAELNAQITGGAEVSVDLTPSAEVTVELTAGAEVALELTEGNTVNVEVRTDRELRFLPDGALADYYRREETDSALARKADRTELELKADRTELDGKAPAVHDHDGRYYTENETDALLALRVPKTDVQFRIFDSVEDLGLTVGSAAITGGGGAYTALPSGSILICPAEEFDASEVPAATGTVVIIKHGTMRGSVLFYAKASAADDGRMFLDNEGLPTGTWLKDVNTGFAATSAPPALGTAAAGTSLLYARADHVHKKPTLSDLGAQAALSVESGTVSGSGVTANFRRYGKIVTMYINGKTNKSTQNILTIGSGWRPALTQEITNTYDMSRLMLSTSGALSFTATMSSGKEIRCSCTYIIP